MTCPPGPGRESWGPTLGDTEAGGPGGVGRALPSGAPHPRADQMQGHEGLSLLASEGREAAAAPGLSCPSGRKQGPGRDGDEVTACRHSAATPLRPSDPGRGGGVEGRSLRERLCVAAEAGHGDPGGSFWGTRCLMLQTRPCSQGLETLSVRYTRPLVGAKTRWWLRRMLKIS